MSNQNFEAFLGIPKQTAVLKELPSGNIEIVFDEETNEPLLQFNCSCEDALPYCHAMCCRGRPNFNVGVYPDEEDAYDIIDYDLNPTQKILACKGNCCTYLNQVNSLCSIHESKPRTCQVWHCSPGGKGDGVSLRAEGWRFGVSKLTGMADEGS